MTDIVVYGATGFVGKLTAEYLARNAPKGVSVALAGRSKEKLEGLGVDFPIVTAESSDHASVRDMVEQAKVVISAVGPYRKHGMPVVAACAEAGVDYVDLTGEPLFIRDSIDQWHKAAEASGARIVHSCGFDSIPSDLGVFLLNEAVKADGAGDLEDTTLLITSMRGGVSGGTLASMTNMLDEIKADPSLRKILDDPYGLSPDRAAEPDLGDEADLRLPVFDRDLKQWLGPFVMAAINTRVVRRSNALTDWSYGRRLRYREAMAMGGGVAGRVKGLALAGAFGAGIAGMGFAPTRAVLDRVLPDPGEGPSEKTQRKGYFNIDVHTRTSTGARYVCQIAAKGDPGYAATAVMLAESALTLLQSAVERAGVLTPATAMGSGLADRLRAAGQSYDVKPG